MTCLAQKLGSEADDFKFLYRQNNELSILSKMTIQCHEENFEGKTGQW